MSSSSAASRREAPPCTRAIGLGHAAPRRIIVRQTRPFTARWESCDSIRPEYALEWLAMELEHRPPVRNAGDNELITIGGLGPVSFRVCEARVQKPSRSRPFHEWFSPQAALWLAFYKDSGGYRLSFPGLADFQISAAGRSIRCWPVPGVLDATIRHLYLNQVLPLALSRQGKLVFHASAVEISNSGVAFFGASGKGKSTLAASFATSGYRFLADDALVIETSEDEKWISPNPYAASMRLWDDCHNALFPNGTQRMPPVQYTPKIRVLAGIDLRFCGERRRVQRLYFLGDRPVKETMIEPLSGVHAMIELIKHSFLLDVEEGAMLAAHFNDLTDLLKRQNCFFRLDYPRSFGALPAVRDAIIAHTCCSKVSGDANTPVGSRLAQDSLLSK
jgi:hypothetical protein